MHECSGCYWYERSLGVADGAPCKDCKKDRDESRKDHYKPDEEEE